MLCWKWETAWLSLHNCHVSYWPSWFHGWVGALAAATQPRRRVSEPVSLAQEELQFKTKNTVFNTYCFPTIIKLKNHKLNHDGSGTDCIHSCFWMPWSSMTYSQKKKTRKKKVKESEGETCWLFKTPGSDPSQREGEGGVAIMTLASPSSLLCPEATPEHRSSVLGGQDPWMSLQVVCKPFSEVPTTVGPEAEGCRMVCFCCAKNL